MRSQFSNKGFTVIEVLIVLAIAGLILLIVFLAIPALQRNARNIERKHDASFIANERTEYDINSGTSLSAPAAQGNCPLGFGAFCQYIDTGLTYYDPTNVTVIFNGMNPPASIPVPTPDTVYSESFLLCNNANNGATTTGATGLDEVVLYALETAGGSVSTQCIQGGLVSQ